MGLSMGFIPQSEGSLTQCCPTQNIVNVNTKANTISTATKNATSPHDHWYCFLFMHGIFRLKAPPKSRLGSLIWANVSDLETFGLKIGKSFCIGITSTANQNSVSHGSNSITTAPLFHSKS
jgi:hypothetical protein